MLGVAVLAGAAGGVAVVGVAVAEAEGSGLRRWASMRSTRPMGLALGVPAASSERARVEDVVEDKVKGAAALSSDCLGEGAWAGGA
jgi:hypothetical protein